MSRTFDARSSSRFMKINQKKKKKETSEISDPNFLMVVLENLILIQKRKTI